MLWLTRIDRKLLVRIESNGVCIVVFDRRQLVRLSLSSEPLMRTNNGGNSMRWRSASDVSTMQQAKKKQQSLESMIGAHNYLLDNIYDSNHFTM
jgi:hypothetical protein